MCTPTAVFSTITTGINLFKENKEAKATQQYQKQIALNNINNAKNSSLEALRLQQEGIEQARKEKIKGLSEISAQKARNAANGIDTNSATSLYNYDDILQNSINNAKATQNQYDLRAKNYFSDTQSYLNSTNSYSKTADTGLYSALGSATRVAQNWYEGYEDYKKGSGYGYI